MNHSISIKPMLFFMAPLMLLSSCALLKVEQPVISYEQIPASTKSIDIPVYGTGHQQQGKPYIFWNFCKQKQKQLTLESPETSQDSLIYRIWITNQTSTQAQPHGLIEIQKDSLGWHAQLILMHVDFDYKNAQEIITDYKIYRQLSPAHLSWDSIAYKLSQLKIDSLPTDDAIPKYYADKGYATNTPTFAFEYATKKSYRFYQYADIYRVPDKFWQAQHVIDILDLMEREFHWDSLGRKYF